ncbi:hypothetical protein OHA21_17995 [Actinoplanes sp. NBC_00393]|uniref:hypothetical protein n=1 Tax=Actinoplanes sp. NBC_00393 TaxID=2975953 RepID=UPI002E2225E6
MGKASIALVVAKGGDIMVQATKPNQGSGRDGFRVGASHDAPVRTASATVPPAGRKLPPIEWARTDYRRIMLTELWGTGHSLVLAIVAFAMLTAAGITLAIVVTTILHTLGYDPAPRF